jgi:mRNA-degrading endonuclease RelE of RelBE toxin-antitoxin system
MQKPSEHSDIKLMRHCNGMQRIRAGNYRALCDRYPPKFRILLVDKRRFVYERTEEAKARQRE